ncbi:MAG TPA: TonB-dependent receptor [Cytophagales bacterium]|jgi:outer membrane receptor protein involved in Fe transport|nr:TonB-dependent receptor [Cytophagales bacterium]
MKCLKGDLRATVLLFIISWCSASVFAQSIHKITGSVKDEENGERVPFTQIALYPIGSDTPAAGATSDDQGQFQLKVKEGEYRLLASFVGYSDKTIEEIKVDQDINLGEIKLASETTQLKEVVVKAEKVESSFNATMEGIEINPERNLSNQGGSVVDILRNTPSINVDQDGNISLRGSSNTNILIDGRNSVLASDLEQIPAAMVDKISIVTNPNAKYDAQGEGGVINIKLKQGEGLGNSGKAELTLGNRERINASLRMNASKKNFNVYGGYSFRQWKRLDNSSTRRETYDNNQLLKQEGTNNRSDWEHTFNFGGDYIWKKNKLSYEGTFNMEDEQDRELNQSRITDLTTGELLNEYARINNETENNSSVGNALIYTRLFDNEEKEFKAFVSHSYRDQEEIQDIDVYSGTYVPGDETLTGNERATIQQYLTNVVAQVDYAQPTEIGKIETGYKLIYRDLDTDYLYEQMDMNSGNFIKNDEVSNRFLYQDQINAAYLILSREIDAFGFSAGVRMENTTVNTNLITTGEENKQQYTDWFPSAQFRYFLDKQNTLKFTYSRRIDRPSPRRLNPFQDISDSLNVRQGNPDLQPEYIQSLEFGHMLDKENWQLTTNLFYRYTDGWVDYIVQVDNGISYRNPANLNSATTYGIEFINVGKIMPGWNINASYSLFRAQVDGRNLDDNYTNDGITWNAKLTSDLKIPFDINWQVNGYYEAPEIEAQGRDLARYYVDMSFSKKILKDKASLNLSLRDIFNTFNFAGENNGEDFSQSFVYNRDTRMILLSMSYQL